MLGELALIIANPRHQIDVSPYIRYAASEDPRVSEEIIKEFHLVGYNMYFKLKSFDGEKIVMTYDGGSYHVVMEGIKTERSFQGTYTITDWFPWGGPEKHDWEAVW